MRIYNLDGSHQDDLLVAVAPATCLHKASQPKQKSTTNRVGLQWILTLSLLATPITVGCGKGEKVGDVQGKATINGEPIAKGDIRFLPIGGEGRATGGLIADGRFQVEVPVGKQRVEIYSNVVDESKTPPNPTPEQIVMKKLVPDRYNTESEEVLDVQPGLNEPEFKLTSP